MFNDSAEPAYDCQRLIELVGTKDSQIRFASFIKDLKTEPQSQKVGKVTFFTLTDQGLEILTENGRVRSIILHTQLVLPSPNFSKCFSGNFIKGISTEDSKAIVRSKLKIQPIAFRADANLNECWDLYEFPDFRLFFLFDETEMKILSIAVRGYD